MIDEARFWAWIWEGVHQKRLPGWKYIRIRQYREYLYLYDTQRSASASQIVAKHRTDQDRFDSLT
jgi:hypothetical protein